MRREALAAALAQRDAAPGSDAALVVNAGLTVCPFCGCAVAATTLAVDEPAAWLEHLGTHGEEGVLVARRSGVYAPGRRSTWGKLAVLAWAAQYANTTAEQAHALPLAGTTGTSAGQFGDCLFYGTRRTRRPRRLGYGPSGCAVEALYRPGGLHNCRGRRLHRQDGPLGCQPKGSTGRSSNARSPHAAGTAVHPREGSQAQ
jgi:hypothetical protein